MRLLQTIQNVQGKTLGKLYEDSNPGDQVLHSLGGAVLGRYYQSGNVTHDGSGRIVGRGNVLMTLIPR